MKIKTQLSTSKRSFYSTLLFVFSQVFLFQISEVAFCQNWSSLNGGMNGWVYATTVYNGELIAAGSFSYAGGVAVNNIARWNGSTWAPLGLGVNGRVNALTVFNGELIAGGEFTEAGGQGVLFLAKWNGDSWTDVNGDMGSIVAAMTVYNNLLIIGGYFTDADGFPANHIVGFNGDSWVSLGTGMGGTQGQVMALTTYNGNLVAGGFFTTAGGVSANHIAQWNGSSWTGFGTGIGNIVYSLVQFNNDLIAGGLFLTAGGVSANHIAKWDGSSWSPLAGGMAGTYYQYVLSLTVYNNDLIAGGLFTQTNGFTSNGIARWDGTNWSAMGGGFSAGGSNVFGAYTLTNYGSNLIAGGIFNTAGTTGVGHIASWSDPVIGVTNDINGIIYYNNPMLSVLPYTTVELYDSTGGVFATTSVDTNGFYSFTQIPDGTYTIIPSTISTWGGVNASDALCILKHFVGMSPLSGIALVAGDVDGNGYLNSVDALMVAKRFTGLVNSFPSGDWYIESATINVSGGGQFSQDLGGVCYGDCNGSFTPMW